MVADGGERGHVPHELLERSHHTALGDALILAAEAACGAALLTRYGNMLDSASRAMAEESGDGLRIFQEDDLRHLLAREVLRCTRYQDFLTLCLVRPVYAGPPVTALQSAVAREIAEMLRSTDVVGFIGDDVAVLLVHTPAVDGTLIGVRIRERIEATTFSLITPSQVTLSIGLSCFPTDATADGALLAHAQAQLQAVLRAGS
jgi:hypothetical protein